MSKDDSISRRNFLRLGLAGAGALGGLSLLPWTGCAQAKTDAIPGEIMGANAKVGHLIREGLQTSPSQTEDIDIAIVGGGIAGLSAGRELLRLGHPNFKLFELDEQTGGNSVSGESNGFQYPWGAHYLPLPNLDNQPLLDLLEQVGCIKGYENGLPLYEELYLCHAPQERLLIHGTWQAGLVPKVGLSEAELKENDRFFDYVDGLKNQIGADGKPVFVLPLDRASADPEWTKLDQIPFSDWLTQKDYQSDALRWYLNYCCRDDYGSTLENTSAWAGLHYFACRNGLGANAETNAVLTWPEGNHWLAQRMTQQLGERVTTRSLVLSLENVADGVHLRVMDTKSKAVTLVRAKKAIYAAPQFTRSYLIGEQAFDASSFDYAPWAVASVHLKQRPKGKGRPLSWDNVPYGRDSLGYIVADHQSLKQPGKKTLVSWYQALTEESAVIERKKAMDRSIEDWQALVVEDLTWMHPEIREDIERIDVWVWGHGMITPRPGFIHGEARKKAQLPLGNIHFAHSDLSGISIFEEAFAQGLRAAAEIAEGEVS